MQCQKDGILTSIDVTIAKDGQEAFELVKQSMADRNLFNLIFMDVQVRALRFPHIQSVHS